MIYKRNLRNIATFFVFAMTVVVLIMADPLCEELPVIKNGQLQLNRKNPPFRLNESVDYSCDENYRSDEMFPKVTCVLHENVANWTEGACKPVIRSCNDPGYIENADRIGNMFTFPHNITYVCKEGFRMIGIATKYCSMAGKWEPPSVPDCEAILCPALNQPSNGEVLHSNRRPASVAAYKCDRYYKLVGDSERVCQADGTWSGSNPTCEKITCMAPGKFPNGRIIGKNGTVYNASDILIFQCNDGTHKTSKCLENGDWSVRPPTCAGTTVIEPTIVTTTFTSEDHGGDEIKDEVNSCEDPGKIKNGDRTFITLFVNSTVTYTCDEGYQLRGKSTLFCMENGKWDLDKLPICVKPLSVPSVIGIVFGVIIFICIAVGGYFWYRYRIKSIRRYGEKSKALTADATDIEEIAGLDRDKKQIPVTVL